MAPLQPCKSELRGVDKCLMAVITAASDEVWDATGANMTVVVLIARGRALSTLLAWGILDIHAKMIFLETCRDFQLPCWTAGRD